MNGDGIHIYHAHALGVAGNIVRADNGDIPLGVIPSKATTSLSHMGGEGHDMFENFKLEGFLSFRKAEVNVTGRYNDQHRCHETIVTSVVEDLDIMGTVKARRIVSKLTSRHPKGTELADQNKPAEKQCLDEPTVSPLGSSFENLEIAGSPIEVRIADQEFHNNGTYSGAKNASDLGQWQLSKQLEQAGGNGEHPSLTQFSNGIKDLLKSHDILACSLVNLDSSKFTDPRIRIFGSVIVVRDFGVVHLGELLIQRHSRRLNMLRVSLGSPVQGSVVAGDTFSNGTTSPPSLV